MKSLKYYNTYMFISTFTRNIIDIYSVVYLYQKFESIKSIIGIYIIIYLLGSVISTISLKLTNSLGAKYIIMASSIITGLSFYIISISSSKIIISIILSLSIFTYHPIKHYYGINLLKDKKRISNNIILIYIASILSSYFAIKKIKIIYLLIIQIISIIPILFINKNNKEKITYPKNIQKNILSFFILDQTKIIFLLLEPLYLYLISNNIKYVGIYNIIIAISSITFIYKFIYKYNIEKYYKIINIIFVVVLILKLNIKNNSILLLIAALEGIGIKTNEVISTMNLYHQQNNTTGYLIVSEIIFCLTRSIILIPIYIFEIKITTIMYLLLIGIFLLSFAYKKDTSYEVSNS